MQYTRNDNRNDIVNNKNNYNKTIKDNNLVGIKKKYSKISQHQIYNDNDD